MRATAGAAALTPCAVPGMGSAVPDDDRQEVKVEAERGAAPQRRAGFRRCVFYIAGFDNIGVRFYYQLFRRGLAVDSRLEGRRYTISRPAAEGSLAHLWHVETADGPTPVSVDYMFLSPYELVRQYHSNRPLGTLRAWAFTLYAYLRHGVLFRGYRTRFKAGAVATYAFSLLPLMAAGGAVVAWGLVTLVDLGASWALQGAVAAAGGFAGLRFGLFVDNKTFANFLLSAMYVGTLHAQQRLVTVDDLTARWARFVAERCAGREWDEVVIVGHSSGTIAAADIAAQLLTVPGLRPSAPLSLLTLGSTDSIVTYFPTARAHRKAIATVATSPDLVWIEYWSAWDFVSMGPHNPVADAGIDVGGRAQKWPVLKALHLKDVFTPEGYRRLPLNWFRRHFQYLKSGDRISGYSYFRMMCSASRLA